ncbi:gliding motility-associated C-terminal domain-containing protein, partial [Flavobacteriales bacterium]|nr:gliding motility-associated C-terminal domain-containing protein [Flavobacteriales bacterium]
CDNVDFELGTWLHWDPSVGDVNCPAGHATGCVQNIVAGTAGTGAGAQHRIVTGGFDNDIPTLPRLNPRGSTYSLMLGDEDGGREVSMIEHVASITSLKPYFTYDFAVVFWDPSHPVQEQPWFNVEFLDSNGIKIPSCGNYFVITGGSVPGFINGTGSWRYKPWSRITVDLTSYIGQDITVKFSVADCGYGAHDGRAYIDGDCFKPVIEKSQNCGGIKLEADSGYLAYQWFDSVPFTLIPGATTREHFIPGPGFFRVRVISESGCTLFIDTLINDIYILLSQTITQVDPSCIGVNDGSLTINPFGGQSPYTFSIDNGATTQATGTFTGLAPGTYTCIVYDSGGCSDTVVYNLTNPPNILPNLVTNDAKCFGICDGEALAVPSGGTSPNGLYRVEFNNVFSITKQRTNLCQGAYTVKVTDENGCFTITPFIIAEPVIENIDAITVVDEKCFNDCSGSITITDATAVEYSINNGLTYQSSNIFTNLCSQAGPYQVAIKTIDGCIGNVIAPLAQPLPLVMPLLKDSFICFNKFASYTAAPLGGTPPYTANWSNGTVGMTMNESPKVSTVYQVSVTDANGCIFTDEFSINLHPQPDPWFEMDPGPITDVFNVDVEFTNTTTYPHSLTYEWYISNLGSFTTRDAFMTFPDKGGVSYTNCLKVENEQGCRDSICRELYIRHELLVFVPNSFTPNDDDINEVFIPSTEGLKDDLYKFMIFNRWGKLVFSTTSKTEGWDGKSNGVLVEEEAYIYRIEGIITETEEEFEKVGHFTILNKL